MEQLCVMWRYRSNFYLGVMPCPCVGTRVGAYGEGQQLKRESLPQTIFQLTCGDRASHWIRNSPFPLQVDWLTRKPSWGIFLYPSPLLPPPSMREIGTCCHSCLLNGHCRSGLRSFCLSSKYYPPSNLSGFNFFNHQQECFPKLCSILHCHQQRTKIVGPSLLLDTVYLFFINW